jgi:hypothetical protein
MAEKKSTGKGTKGVNRFVVGLGGVKLPEATARELAADIRKAVLATVATLDFQGDLQISAPGAAEAVIGLGGPTQGIVIKRPKPIATAITKPGH